MSSLGAARAGGIARVIACRRTSSWYSNRAVRVSAAAARLAPTRRTAPIVRAPSARVRQNVNRVVVVAPSVVRARAAARRSGNANLPSTTFAHIARSSAASAPSSPASVANTTVGFPSSSSIATNAAPVAASVARDIREAPTRGRVTI